MVFLVLEAGATFGGVLATGSAEDPLHLCEVQATAHFTDKRPWCTEQEKTEKAKIIEKEREKQERETKS